MKSAIFSCSILSLFLLISCSDNGNNPAGNGTQMYDVNVSVSPTEAGSISPSADSSYEEGSDVEFEAEPVEGYTFVNWTGDIETSDNPVSVTVDQDYSLTANYEQKSYALTTNTEGEGEITEEVVQEKSRDYEHGTVVELTANPAEGYTFVEWTGDLESTESPSQITVDEPKEVTAVFEKKSYTLTTNTEGEGTIAEEIIQQKSRDYEHGTVVELTANPADGYQFVEWTGDLSGSESTAQITVDEPKEVTAVFEEQTFTLTVETSGQGTVTKSPDQPTYNDGTVVELTPNPAEGYTFVEWQGALSGTENPAQITVEDNQQVTAIFEIQHFALTVNTTGNGSVTKSPDQATYEYGTTVELEAMPADGQQFVEWTGAITSTNNPVEVTINEETQITATFEEPSFYLALNEVTVKCTDAAVGETGTVGGVTYTKRSKSQITPSNAPTTCTSGFTDMSALFEDANAFNGDISHWDVSQVTNMSNMFYDAGVFEGDLSNWDVSSVEDMSYMFSGADNFNGDLSSWDVSSVTNMQGMFARATPFNGDLSSWDVSAVTNMTAMFSGTSFNQNLNDWDVSAVTNMSSMFRNVETFDQDLSSWEVANVVDMGGMFTGAINFNGDISSWDVSSVEDMGRMFYEATAFNQDLSNWDVTSVTNMGGMFRDATNFNADISGWTVSTVADMSFMFYNADAFNADLGSWDVTGVTSATNMSRMFGGADSFNQDLNSWCVAEIGYEPYAFATGTEMSDGQLPNWGDPCS